MSLKSLGKAILPPFVLSAYRHLCGQTSNDWKGNYSHWQEAVAMSLGYDTDEIFQKVLSASRRVRDGDALWERDSVCFFHEEYNWPLLACLLFVASHNNNALHVLDFGGALGSTYMQHRKALSGLKECSWNIVEQEHFVQCGKQEFQTETLRFFESMEDCLAQCHINLVLFSGVLSYVENSYDLLVRATESSSAVLIDRTPFSERGERICVQKVSDSIYKASYPCRFLDRSKVEKVLSSDGRILLPWFRSSIDPSSFWGVLSVKERDLRMYRG